MASILFGRKRLYEPTPRFSHGAAAVEGRCYLWGGCVQDFTEGGRRKLASTVEIFDPNLGTWEEHPTTGVPPPGLYSGACTSLLDSLYWFGGNDGKYFYNSLHRLDPTTLEWRELQPLNQAQPDGPMKKIGCGMVSFFRDQLAVFGGYGIPTGPTQPQTLFTKDVNYNTTDGRGWSNELHVFNIMEGKWSSPPTTGTRPPPCSHFSFTTINNHQAVLFGGGQPGRGSRVSDCYVMDFVSMEWTKLERPMGAPWPVERASHAAICLNYGEEHPQLLVTGGVDNSGTTLQDAWILDVKSGRWSEVNLPEDAQPRMWHTVTALNLWPGRTQVTMFGGSPKWERGKTDAAQQKLAKTTVLEFESAELPSSGDCPPTREWVLVDVVKSSQLGSRKRLARLEKMKQTKIGPEREREIKELKERVHQKEKVTFLEQQLSQTKTDLEEHIRMKDAAELQLNQTKTALQLEIQFRDRELSTLHQLVQALEIQMKVRQKALQSQIQAKDKENAELEEQLCKKEELIQAKEEEKAKLEQQLCQKGEQIRFKDEDKAELEEQLCQKGEQIQTKQEDNADLELLLHEKEEDIQVKGKDNAELEEQLHQKEDQIQTKDRENAELEEQLRQKEEHIQTKDRENAELKEQVRQKEEHIQTKDKENAELEEQLHQKEEHIQTKDKENAELEEQLRQKEEHIQTKDRENAELEEQLHQKEEQIRAKDKENAELKQQLRQKEEHNQTKDKENAELEEQLHQKEEHIQTKDKENAELKQQLRQKEEHIQTKDKENAELEEQLHQKEEHIQTKDKENADLKQQLRQKEEHIQTKDKENAELEEQLHQKEEQIRAKNKVGSDKVEVRHDNEEADILQFKDQNMQTEIVQIKDQQVQAESTEQLQASFDTVEMKDQQIQTETLEPVKRHMQAENTTEPQAHLHGAEVVAETTFTLTPEEQMFEFKGYGFKLHVPKDSLPAEVSETQLNVRVSLSGQFQLPSECELVSAVYWVSCTHKFTKPLVVEIQHCAALSRDKQCEQLTFVRTKCTQKELPYTFTELGGVFNYLSSYGSLSLSHFSGLGVGRRRGCKVHRPRRARPAPYRVQPMSPASRGTIQVLPQQSLSEQTTDIVPSELSLHSEGEDEQSEQDEETIDQYCGQVYTKKGTNDCRVYFVITRNLDAHRTVVREFYSTRMQARENIKMGLEFGEDRCISLAIPRSGIILQSGWKIIPRYNLMIRKANVDHFSCGGMIPKCELLLRWPHRDKPHVCLEHDIELTGAKDCSYFTLYIPDAAEDSPTLSPAAADSGLFSPNSGSSISSPRAGSDKAEVRHHNEETHILEFKDQNMQAESTTQQQAGFDTVEMEDQQIQMETVKPHVQAENTTESQVDSDEVEVKKRPQKIETVLAEDTIQQQEYLRGFETFAETSINIFDCDSHSFEWQRYGFKLHIPEGAVPAEHADCKIDIKVGLNGQFRIPDDLQLVSCIYWLRGPQRPFLKPVTLEIEHCASLQDFSQSETLRFVVAKCSQPELPYQFRVLEKGTFVPQTSYGNIQVSQFSFFGITISRRSSRLSQYYSALFYIQKGLNWWDVDFVITLNLKGSWKAIEDNYSRLNAIFGPHFMVKFENETISLEIPEDGVCLENGWTITPLVPPVIDKEQVDGFKEHQKVPYCRLQVKLDKDKKPTDLKHKVKLQGAKRPRDFFIIICPPEECVERQNGDTVEKRKPSGGIEQGGGFETKPILKDLIDALYHKVADKWKVIGVLLEIPKGVLSRIADKHQRDPCSCLVEMLETWLERVHPPPTWAAIIEDVEFLGEEQLGKELRNKYCPTVCK